MALLYIGYAIFSLRKMLKYRTQLLVCSESEVRSISVLLGCRYVCPSDGRHEYGEGLFLLPLKFCASAEAHRPRLAAGMKCAQKGVIG